MSNKEFDVLKSSQAYEEVIKQYPNVSHDSWKREFAHSYWQQGARWQFYQSEQKISELKDDIEALEEKVKNLEIENLKAKSDWYKMYELAHAKQQELAHSRLTLMNNILVNIREHGLDETYIWLKSRFSFEKESISVDKKGDV